MKWENLRENRCPKCGKDIGFDINSQILFCSRKKCDFRISQEKMRQLVTEKVIDQIERCAGGEKNYLD